MSESKPLETPGNIVRVRRPALFTIGLLAARLSGLRPGSADHPDIAVPTRQTRTGLVVVNLVTTDRAGNFISGPNAADQPHRRRQAAEN